jgi:hypothetical protein
MLLDTGKIGKSNVNELDLVFLDEIKDFSGILKHLFSLAGASRGRTGEPQR